MDVIAAIHGRRSVRSYQPTPVPRELIEATISDAAQAPPPFRGMVPWAFNVIEGVARIAAYGERAMDHSRKHRPEGADWVERPGFKVFWDAPVVIRDFRPRGRLLARRAEPDAVGACARARLMLGRLADALDHHARGTGRIENPGNLEPVAVFCLGYAAATPEPVVHERPPVVWS